MQTIALSLRWYVTQLFVSTLPEWHSGAVNHVTMMYTAGVASRVTKKYLSRRLRTSITGPQSVAHHHAFQTPISLWVTVAVEPKPWTPQILKNPSGRDPEPFLSTSQPQNPYTSDPSYCYSPISFSVFQVDDFQEVSPPKFCMHF